MPPNPPRPQNTQIWTRPVSPDMTAWAKSILDDSFDYPMFSETKNFFGGVPVLARVEWHDWTYRNGVEIRGVFRGVTLYEILSGAVPGGEAAATTAVDGIDVSHYQGVIDWRKVASAGKLFAFMKTTEGSGAVDSKFDANWSACRSAGILRGAYHFFRADEDALAQAKLFLSRIEDRGELPPVIDVEETNGVGLDELASGVSAWVDYVATNYARPIVYTRSAFWNPLPEKGVATKADLWVAKWGATAPEPFGGWNNWSFWQFSETGNVSGIGGAVDLDRFNGSLDDLHVYVTRSGDGTAPEAPTFELTTTSGVQQALNYLGTNPPLDVDGVAGPRTRAAVQAFQRANGLSVDGVVGPKTIAALQKALEMPAAA